MSHEEGRKLIEDLRELVEREEFMYHHDWEDGDMVISEQYLSIHKRWEFEHMDTRVLHRMTVDLSNIDIDKLK
jgi:alpha-ketoglutarate-dependent taurine dioxygenase